MTDTQRLEHVFTVQQRIAQVARERPHEVFTSLNHYLDVDWLKAAYERVKPDSAPGVDGRSWADYGKETRPIGMPTIEDKVLQRAVAMLLEPIYEQDFKCFSYGFRPGRSAHEALSCIWSQGTTHRIAWILDVDVRKYFDDLPQSLIKEAVAAQVADGNILNLVEKFLRAGVMEDGVFKPTTVGTPQGGGD